MLDVLNTLSFYPTCEKGHPRLELSTESALEFAAFSW